MALNLFERIETKKGLFAVEKMTLIYTLLTTILILFMYHRMDHPLRMLWDRSLIVGITFLLMWLYRLAPCKGTAFVRIIIQLTFLSYWYPDTFEFNRLLPNLDHIFAWLEQCLFGSQPAITFAQTLPSIWTSEAFNMGYFAYYPMILAVCLYYFFFRYELFEKLSFVLITSFFVYYLIYIFVPVAGPQFYFPAIGAENVAAANFPNIHDYFNHHMGLLPGTGYQDGLFYNLVETSQQLGERPTAAFPSSHVGISTILMIMAYRENKWFFAILSPFYVLLCCATVYIQAHYLIDAIAGFISAIIIYVLVTKLYKRWFDKPVFKFEPID